MTAHTTRMTACTMIGITKQANVKGCIPKILSEANEGTNVKLVRVAKPNEGQRSEINVSG
ncbi:MAG: hypothetical protein ACUVQ5_01325 [Candidatus Methanomethylicaceae archaeon]